MRATRVDFSKNCPKILGSLNAHKNNHIRLTPEATLFVNLNLIMPREGLFQFLLTPEATLFGVLELFEEFFLLAAEVTRSLNDDGDDVRTAVAVGTEGDAMATELEWGAGLGAGGDFHGDFAVDSFNFDFGAEGGVNHADVFFGKNDGAFASEVFVRLNFDADVEVARFGGAFWGGATFAAESDRHAVVDAGGDFDFEVFTFDGDGLGGAEDGFFES